MIVLDFETRSRVNIETHGLDNYLHCPDFAALVACTWNLATGERQTSDSPDALRAHLAPILSDSTAQILAHNALFEYLVCCKLAKDWGLPEPALGRFHCTAARANVVGLPAGLDALGKVLLGAQKQADGKTLVRLFGTPQKDGSWATRSTHPDEWARYVAYCEQDVTLTGRLDGVLPQLTHRARRYWLSVSWMNLRGFLLDLPIIYKVLGDVALLKADSDEIIKAMTDGAATKATQVQRLKQWFADQNFPLESLSAEVLAHWTKHPDTPEDIRKILYARLRSSKSTFGKYRAFLNYAGPDHRNRHGFWFSGAHTGRLSGKGSQPQNIARGSADIPYKAPDLLERYARDEWPAEVDKADGLVAMTRAVVMAPPGKQLYIVDYAGIEARLVAWISNHDAFLKRYRNKEDLYIPMAAEIFGIPAKDVTKHQRNQYGKVTVLGGGYGMGAARFAQTNNMTLEEGERCISAYRRVWYTVPTLWRALESGFKACLASGQPRKINNVRFDCVELGGVRHVVATPPGGCPIWYRDPKVGTDGNISYERITHTGSYRTGTWGGTLLENICQNMAGVIISHGTFNIEKLGALPVMQIHDELVCEVPEGVDTAALDAAMVDIPGFDGLPLAVESRLAKRFSK